MRLCTKGCCCCCCCGGGGGGVVAFIPFYILKLLYTCSIPLYTPHPVSAKWFKMFFSMHPTFDWESQSPFVPRNPQPTPPPPNKTNKRCWFNEGGHRTHTEWVHWDPGYWLETDSQIWWIFLRYKAWRMSRTPARTTMVTGNKWGKESVQPFALEIMWFVDGLTVWLSKRGYSFGGGFICLLSSSNDLC